MVSNSIRGDEPACKDDVDNEVGCCDEELKRWSAELSWCTAVHPFMPPTIRI